MLIPCVYCKICSQQSFTNVILPVMIMINWWCLSVISQFSPAFDVQTTVHMRIDYQDYQTACCETGETNWFLFSFDRLLQHRMRHIPVGVEARLPRNVIPSARKSRMPALDRVLYLQAGMQDQVSTIHARFHYFWGILFWTPSLFDKWRNCHARAFIFWLSLILLEILLSWLNSSPSSMYRNSRKKATP